jgi:hypothetical protein
VLFSFLGNIPQGEIFLRKYTQMNSKFGVLARMRRQFLDLEQATIAKREGASKDRKLAAKLTRPKTQF